MPNDRYYLTERDRRTLQEDHRKLANLPVNGLPPTRQVHPRPNLTREIRFGKPTSAYSSGSTMTLDHCDVSGTDLSGRDNVTVYVQASQASYSMTNSTTVSTSTIVPYVRGTDGSWYVLGSPHVVITAFRYDTSTHKLQYKMRHIWGSWQGSESDWQDAETAVECVAPA